MFKMKRADTAPEMTPMQRAAEALTAVIASITKPNKLILAERLLKRARERMAELAETERAALRQHHKRFPTSTSLPAEIQEIQAEHQAATNVVRTHRTELTAEREAFGPKFMELHARQVADVQTEMLALIDQLQAGAEALRAAKRFAGENALPIQRLVQHSDYIHGALADLRRVIR